MKERESNSIQENNHANVSLLCHSHTQVRRNDTTVKATAENVDEAVRELPDANLVRDQKLCGLFILDRSTQGLIKGIVLHGQPYKSVHLVELKGTGELYAMKAMDKSVMLTRNKEPCSLVQSYTFVDLCKRDNHVISLLIIKPAMKSYADIYLFYSSTKLPIEVRFTGTSSSPQTSTHVCLITDFCPGGELFALLDKQPMKLFKEESARFYVAEVVVGLEYLHCLGIIYRDLKPENVLLQKDGHIVLTDFDLSFMTSCKPQIIKHPLPKKRRSRSQPPPIFVAEPVTQSNSFVGTEEYIAPEIITGDGHSSAIDWWALGKHLVSLAGRQLIHALLNRDPVSRLGSSSGANDIKQHPFFRGINWPLIRCMSPPPLDVPLQLIGKDPKAKDLLWEDEGVPGHSMEFF
ncbi:hypothetical protein TEA_015767 [Camellia sinensis var. sinensis]|uniref:non-specific serine/threonine protein kinase n=1 Tax=Camellia sinensis var. sinensis TaxID=542762 RepID=A0A4S4EBC6_CAMSN|nr:hypothetical protein TEA_015767 [Camellia sinensis var. sinensis]